MARIERTKSAKISRANAKIQRGASAKGVGLKQVQGPPPVKPLVKPLVKTRYLYCVSSFARVTQYIRDPDLNLDPQP